MLSAISEHHYGRTRRREDILLLQLVGRLSHVFPALHIAKRLSRKNRRNCGG
jgi:hypothetical protein